MNICVYSPKPGSGASTVARMLAFSLASKASVLYVELDYFYPSATLAFGLYDKNRNLNRSVADFNHLGDKEWVLENYLLSYPKTNISFLAPHGKTGFEYFPDENPNFVSCLLEKASKSGYEHVILDVPSMPDTLFCTKSLAMCELVFCVLDNSYYSIPLYHQRMELFKKLEIVENMEIVINQLHKKNIFDRVIKNEILDKNPVAFIPYNQKLHELGKKGTVHFPYRLRKEMKKTIEKCIKDEVREV